MIAVVLLSSMYGFVAPDAKSSDHFFTGFPSYWNIVVLYLMLFRVPPFYNALVLLVLSALVFVRIGYVYPSRTPTLRALTLALGSVWAVAGRRDHLDVAVAAALDGDRLARVSRLLHRALVRASRASPPATARCRPVIPARITRDRILAALFACLVAVTAITVVWSMRQGWAVYKLRRGVGDTWFYSADGRPWFRMDEQRRDVAARRRSRRTCATPSSPSRIIASTTISGSIRSGSAARCGATCAAAASRRAAAR